MLLDVDRQRRQAWTTKRGVGASSRTSPRGRAAYATGLGLSTGRALLNGYGGDLILGDEQESGTTFTLSMPTRVPMHVQRAGTRRVRLLVRDPRQLAMLRLLIRHRGLEELAPSSTDTADLTICDVDELPSLLGAESGTASTVPAASLRSAPHRADMPPASVRWVDPRDFSLLDDVLH